ncbi:MAG: DUF2920 family protein [Armatimonadota bacterium]
MTRSLSRFGLLCCLLLSCVLAWTAEMPPLPEKSGQVTFSVQDEPGKAARELTVFIRYPKGLRASIDAGTGLMLVLHNWGGRGFSGAPFSDALTTDYNVVVIGVDYFQSGDDPKDPTPYDFGYLQALDALRGLYYVYQGLDALKIPFDHRRIYGGGGSGGGNVIQMANKLAPRTFACIVDCSGMASLTDDIAYGLPGGSGLNARYSKDPASPAYLAPHMQEIRDIGNPAHLAVMVRSGNRCKIVVIHGEDDGSCLAADKKRVVEAMRAARLDVDPHFISAKDVDGKLILNSSHSIGNRHALLCHFAGPYLTPGGEKACRLPGPSDFEKREKFEYKVTGGKYTVDFTKGWPGIAFRAGK